MRLQEWFSKEKPSLMPSKIANVKYHREAKEFLYRFFTQNSGEERLYFNFEHMSEVANTARMIAHDQGLQHNAYENVLVAAWFRFACMGDPIKHNTDMNKALLLDFFGEVNYPPQEQVEVLTLLKRNISIQQPQNDAEAVLWDASHIWLAADNILAKVHLFKEDVNRIFSNSYSELDILKFVYNQFVEGRYYTQWAQEHATKKKERNLLIIEKQMDKSIREDSKKAKVTAENDNYLGTKETEDLFKIAFRNYNHLVSIADAKARLLIQVNALLISFVVAFVLGRLDRYPLFLYPSCFLLLVCVATISLSILASRPRSNVLAAGTSATVYQKFFFGSFDQVDVPFSKLSWEKYEEDLKGLLKSGRDNLFEEVYKETFNVRKILGYKFKYLSIAYWVFLWGLALSISGFILSLL
jgi:hypothetical protein